MKQMLLPSGFSMKPMLWVMLLSLTVIFAALVSSYVRYDQTLEDYRILNRSNEISREIGRLRSLLYETESGVRAFLMTSREDVLPMLDLKSKEAARQWRKIEVLTDEDKIQQQLLDSIMPLIDIRFMQFQNSVDAKRMGDDSTLIEHVLRSKAIMEQFADLTGKMLSNETKVQNEHYGFTRSGARMASGFLLVASFFSLVIIVLAWLMLIRAFNAENKCETIFRKTSKT